MNLYEHNISEKPILPDNYVIIKVCLAINILSQNIGFGVEAEAILVDRYFDVMLKNASVQSQGEVVCFGGQGCGVGSWDPWGWGSHPWIRMKSIHLRTNFYSFISKCKTQILQDVWRNLQDSKIFKAIMLQKAGWLVTMFEILSFAKPQKASGL